MNIEHFLKEIKRIKTQYETQKDRRILERELSALAEKYRDCFGVGDYLLCLAEQYMDSGDHEAGVLLVQTVDQTFPNVANEVTLCLRMAEYCLERGDRERGINYLERLCTQTVDHYEESIENNGLTALWEKYKHLVQPLVPPVTRPLPPEQCRMPIGEILALPEDERLAELFDHLNELSADGTCINELNRWEQVLYYVNELCMQVNSGGFMHYLYYDGSSFEKARRALMELQAEPMSDLMNAVQKKFPKKHIPETLEGIQAVLEQMEETGVDFENEDRRYYECVEKELLAKLTLYILQNKEYLR